MNKTRLGAIPMADGRYTVAENREGIKWNPSKLVFDTFEQADEEAKSFVCQGNIFTLT